MCGLRITSGGCGSIDDYSELQVLPKIHIANQPMQIIRMKVQQLCGFREIPAGLFNGSQDQLPLYGIHGIVISRDTDIRTLVVFNQGLRQIFRSNVIGRTQYHSSL